MESFGEVTAAKQVRAVCALCSTAACLESQSACLCAVQCCLYGDDGLH